MKKICSILIISTILLITPTTIFAHGHNKNHIKKYNLCNLDNCDIINTHKHNNINYSGHYFDDGHDYHELCDADNCKMIKNYTHH